MKDPAILFYTSDFLTGTAFFTDEERGRYIRLLCEQHQIGRIPENHMLSVCLSLDSPVVSKFKKDDNGMYYNERMEQEMIKRREFTESRRLNGLKGGRPKKECKPSDKPLGLPSGEASENLIEDGNINDIISYLNEKSNKNFKSKTQKTRKLIKTRLNEGFTLEDFKSVIDCKVKDWLNDEKMSEYLRPETLFGTKFEGYLNSIPKKTEEPRLPKITITSQYGQVRQYRVATVEEAKQKYYEALGVDPKESYQINGN